MSTYIINNITIVNEGECKIGSVLIENNIISKISALPITKQGAQIIEGENLHLFPGCIDDQVHFREPGLTHKGNIASESVAAVAGGITSFMEMPNTLPPALTQELLAHKYDIAKSSSLANYSFYMGVSNDNVEEVLKTDKNNVCGIKIFMGSSTGNLLVDNEKTLNDIFAKSPMLIATHCEDEQTIKNNLSSLQKIYGDKLTAINHAQIRSREACFKSSSHAVSLAKKYGTRLHVLHISTADELILFDNNKPSKDKKITAEACIHHLWFCNDDYETKGNFIKWNPAIKTKSDRDKILAAVINNTIDVIATDHAPHTLEEKNQPYLQAPSGGPLVQHALLVMLQLYHQNKITLPMIASKMSHAVADIFRIQNRGYVREGYFADLVIVNLNEPTIVSKNNLLYHCGWSPFEGEKFNSTINKTFVNGHLAYNSGHIDLAVKGMRLAFER